MASVYWSDGLVSTPTIVSPTAGQYEVQVIRSFKSDGTHRAIIAFSDPTSALAAFTASPANSPIVWFAQTMKGLSSEASVKRRLLHFYGDLRGDTNANFNAIIDWETHARR